MFSQAPHVFTTFDPCFYTRVSLVGNYRPMTSDDLAVINLLFKSELVFFLSISEATDEMYESRFIFIFPNLFISCINSACLKFEWNIHIVLITFDADQLCRLFFYRPQVAKRRQCLLEPIGSSYVELRRQTVSRGTTRLKAPIRFTHVANCWYRGVAFLWASLLLNYQSETLR